MKLSDDRIDALFAAHLPAEADRLTLGVSSAAVVAARLGSLRRRGPRRYRLFLIAAVVASALGGAVIGAGLVGRALEMDRSEADLTPSPSLCTDSSRPFVSPDGNRRAFGCFDNVQVIDLGTGRVTSLPLPDELHGFGLSGWSGEGTLVVGGADRPTIIDAETGEVRRSSHMDWPHELSIAFGVPAARLHPTYGINFEGVQLSPDGKRLAVAIDAWICPASCTGRGSFDDENTATAVFVVNVEDGSVDLEGAWRSTRVRSLHFDGGRLVYELEGSGTAIPVAT